MALNVAQRMFFMPKDCPWALNVAQRVSRLSFLMGRLGPFRLLFLIPGFPGFKNSWRKCPIRPIKKGADAGWLQMPHGSRWLQRLQMLPDASRGSGGNLNGH